MFIAAVSNADLSPIGATCLCLSGQNAVKNPKLTPMVRLQTAPTGPGDELESVGL